MDKMIAGDWPNELAEEWGKFLKSRVDHYKKCHDLTIKEAREKKVPVLFVRYEDLIIDPSKIL